MHNLFLLMTCFFLINVSCDAVTTDELAQNAEKLCYEEFILPQYPDGLRANWGGVYSNYLTSHPDDDWYNPHNVITESTTLLAQLAALRGDEQTLAEMIDLLKDPTRHGSDQFKLFQWLLDPNGEKVPLGQGFANASGEENRMLEVLKLAWDQFGDTGLINYIDAAAWIVEGLKGTGGGMGNLEPPPYDLVYQTNHGVGGAVAVKFPGDNVSDVLILCSERNTPYGYSLFETEILDASGTNISAQAVAYASTSENDDYSALKANDGDFTTRWSSQFQDLQWLWLQFNGPKQMKQITVHWEAASARSYQVVALQTVVTLNGLSLNEVIQLPQAKKTRFVRILGLQLNPVTNEHHLSEIRIFGPTNPSLNLAAHQITWISRDVAQTGFLTDENPQTGCSWNTGEKFWALIDLGQIKTIDRIEIDWVGGSDQEYAIQISPQYTAQASDGYLVRPQFVWQGEAGLESPVTAPGEVTDITLGNYNYLGLYYAWKWLGDSFFQKAVQYAASVAMGAQNKTSGSAGYGLFHNKYNIRNHQYESEYGDNVSTTLSNCDIATRLGAYGEISGNLSAITVGKRYATFLKKKYVKDGIIWAGFDYITGEPKWRWEGLSVSAFAAKLFIQFNEFSTAEKIIREKILPFQRLDAADPYYGAIMEALNDTEAQASKYKDAAAFGMLESLIALHQWSARPKGTWISAYPKEWVTAYTVTGGDGGEDIIVFRPKSARYVRILCKRKTNPDWGYSLFSFNVYSSSTSTKNLAYNKSGSISSAQFDDDNYLPMWKAFDSNDTTRWASVGGNGQTTEWIYVDLGSVQKIGKIRLLWENAYAADYEVQVAMPSN